jgi:CheY-like chemotaxis protein
MDERVTFHSDIDASLELELDAELIWYICRNACSNALKYGHSTLPVYVFVTFDSGELVLRVINSPGPDHTQLVQLPNPNVVFEQSKRLHATLHAAESAGDGAWIMQQCAEAISGTCSISFLEDKTVFDFRCPCDVHVKRDINEQYDIPEDTIVVVVDDSKMQRTALHRMLLSEGILESNVHMLGDKYQTLESLCMQIKSIISGKHLVLCILDQNLDYPEGSLRGTSVSSAVRKMVDDKQKMITLIRSANDSAADREFYRKHATDFMSKMFMRQGKFREFILKQVMRVYGRQALVKCGPMRGIMALSEIEQGLKDEMVPLMDALMAFSDQEWESVWPVLHKIKDCAAVVQSTVTAEIIEIINSMRGDVFPVHCKIQIDKICQLGRSLIH